MITDKTYFAYCGHEISDQALNILGKVKEFVMEAKETFTETADCLFYLFCQDFSAIGLTNDEDVFEYLEKEQVCIFSFVRRLINSREYKNR